MESWRKEAQKKHLSYLAKNEGGFEFTDTFVPYTSGQIGPYYIQSGAIMKSGENYAEACEDMLHLVKENIRDETKVISGGHSRDWMFSFHVAQGLPLPHLMIYKDGKTHGRTDLSEGYTAHVADLNNEGSSVRDLWVPKIKELGGKIKDIFFYVDRREDGFKVVGDLELNSHALVYLDEDAWDFLVKERVLTEEVYKSLRERMEDKDAWARRMLRSERGLQTLTDLATNKEEGSFDKAKKILTKGYPDMAEELTREVNSRAGIELKWN